MNWRDAFKQTMIFTIITSLRHPYLKNKTHSPMTSSYVTFDICTVVLIYMGLDPLLGATSAQVLPFDVHLLITD